MNKEKVEKWKASKECVECNRILSGIWLLINISATWFDEINDRLDPYGMRVGKIKMKSDNMKSSFDAFLNSLGVSLVKDKQKDMCEDYDNLEKTLWKYVMQSIDEEIEEKQKENQILIH